MLVTIMVQQVYGKGHRVGVYIQSVPCTFGTADCIVNDGLDRLVMSMLLTNFSINPVSHIVWNQLYILQQRNCARSPPPPHLYQL